MKLVTSPKGPEVILNDSFRVTTQSYFCSPSLNKRKASYYYVILCHVSRTASKANVKEKFFILGDILFSILFRAMQFHRV